MIRQDLSKNHRGDVNQVFKKTKISLFKYRFLFSVSAEDELWGINHEGQLCQRRVYYLQRNDVLEDLDTQQVNRNSISEDWEFI